MGAISGFFAEQAKRQRQTRSARGCLGAIGIIAALVAPPALGQDVHANLNHEMTDTVIDRAVLEMARELGEQTDGRIDITVHSRGEMGGERSMFDLMQAGAIEMGVSGAVIISAAAPEFGVLDAPYLFKSKEHLHEVMEGPVGEALRDAILESKGIRIIGRMDRPPRHITTKGVAIRTPQDMEGLKIRTREIPVQVEAFRMIGGSPVPMAFGEVYTALQTGVIDAQENPLEQTLGASFDEVQDHVILTGHVREIQWLIVSEVWWQGLSEEDRVLITDAAGKAMAQGQDEVYANDERLLEEAQQAGMTIVELTPEERDAFQQAVADLPNKFADVWQPGLYEKIVAAGQDQ
jgi:TRAP-type transport system periplasmic protein